MTKDNETEDYIMSIAGIDEDEAPDNSDGGQSETEENGVQKDVGDKSLFPDGTPGNNVAQNKPEEIEGQQSANGQQQPGDKSKQGDQKATPMPLRSLGDGSFADEKGNIVDEGGRIIAPAGVSARLHGQNRRLKQELDAATSEGYKLYEANKVFASMSQAVTQANISHDELATAIDMAGRMKTNPLSVAKEIVAMVAAEGYNVTDLLGADVGDSIDMKAIKQMIDTRLAPITQQEQVRTQNSQHEAAALKAYNGFVSQNTYADVHADEIASVMQKYGLKPQAAYNELMSVINRNGLDPSQPLQPQIAMRKQRMQQQPAAQQNNAKPMPNGAVTRSATVGANTVAQADTSWDDLIRSAMKS